MEKDDVKLTPEYVAWLNNPTNMTLIMQSVTNQMEIDAIVTGDVALTILEQNVKDIKEKLMANNGNNRVFLIGFESTFSYLRYLKGSTAPADKPLGVEMMTLEEARKVHPNSQALKTCDPKEWFCIFIATMQRTSLCVMSRGTIDSPLSKDGMMSQTVTSIKLSRYI